LSSRRAGVGLSFAWLASVGEDVGLLTNEFLPEFLLVSVLLLVLWGIRKRLGRDARSTF
jgi:hypothetical protein